MKRISTILLALAMVLALTGCGGADAPAAPTQAPDAVGDTPAPLDTAAPVMPLVPESDPAAETAVPGAVTVSLPAGEMISGAQVMNDRIYIAANDGSDPEAILSSTFNKLYTAALDGSGLTPFWTTEDSQAERFAACPDGAVWLYYYSFDQDGPAQTLQHLGPDGSVLATVDLDTLTSDDILSFNKMLPREGGVTIVSGANQLITLDGDGNVVSNAVSSSYFSNIICLADGRTFAVTENNGLDGFVSSLVQVDTATGTVTGIPVTADGGLGNYATLVTGEGNSLYFTRISTVYALDMTTGGETELAAWVNAGVNVYDQKDCFVRDGVLWSVEAAEGSGTLNLFPVRLGADERTVLTLATMKTDYTLTPQVAKFNRTNSEYRIEVKDYTADDPWRDHALEKLNYDIISGDVPDMYILDDMPQSALKKQGLLLDLSELLADDEAIHMEDYLDKVLEAGREDDGQLLSLFAEFNIETLAALPGQDVTEQNNTLDNFCALQARDPNVAVVQCQSGGQVDFLASLVKYDPSFCLDLASGTCFFDGTKFRSLATALSVMPTEEHDSALGTTLSRPPYRMFSAGISTYAYSLNFSNSASYGQAGDATQSPPDQTGSTLVGYPTSSGGKHIICPREEFAISSQTENAQACWSFLRTFLLDDFQLGEVSSLTKGFDGLPVKRSAAEAQASACIAYDAATQADVDALNAVLDGDRLQIASSDLLFDIGGILAEEMMAYYDGADDLDTAVASLQSRVGLYLAEHS